MYGYDYRIYRLNINFNNQANNSGSNHTVLSCVDGSVYARFFSTDVDRYEERSCVRPVGAVYITAGLDEVRVPGP